MNKKAKRIAALAAILLLAGLYLATFIVAFLSFPGWERLFQACLVATVGLPILLWIYIWIFEKIAQQKKNNAENRQEQK